MFYIPFLYANPNLIYFYREIWSVIKRQIDRFDKKKTYHKKNEINGSKLQLFLLLSSPVSLDSESKTLDGDGDQSPVSATFDGEGGGQ